jgi:cohesin complex subunit SCC1
MFYSQSILARKSPLGTVWIAAHLERKVKKAQVDGIDIPTYARMFLRSKMPSFLPSSLTHR